MKRMLNDINNEVSIAPIVYLSILMVIGIPGNLFVLLIYWKRYSKSVYRTIIFVIACTDLFFCTFALSFNIGRIIRYYTFYNVWICKCFTAITLCTVLLSSHLVVLLSFHRFRQVCVPHKSQINSSNIRYWLAGGFILAVIFHIPQFVLQPLDQVQIGENITGYVCSVSFKKTVFAEIFNGFLIVLYGTYALILFILYSLIGRKLYMQRKIRQDIKANDDELPNKVTKIAITVSVVYALSNIPLLFLKLFLDVTAQESLNNAEFSTLKIFERSYAMNHVANPFIYAFFDNRFRFYFRNLVTRSFHRRRI